MQVQERQKKAELRFGMIFILCLSVMPVIALVAPRFLAFWPGVSGGLLLMFSFFTVKTRLQFPIIPLYWIGGITVMAGLSCLWAIDPDFAVSRTFKIASVLFSGAVLIAMVRTVKPAMITPYLHFFTISVMVCLLLCIFEILADYPLYRLLHGMDSTQEVAGSNLNRTIIALLSVSFVALSVSVLRKQQKTMIGLFMLCGALLLLSQSQSAQLGAMLAVVCYFLFPYGHKITWRVLGCILVLGVLLAPFLSIWMFSNFAETIGNMPFFGDGDGFGGQRLEIWDAVARYALQNPLYGFGLEATRHINDFDMQNLYRESSTALHPHNFAMQLWIEFGVIGAVFGAAFLAFIIRTVSHYNYEQARIALPTFVVLLTAASFGYGLWQSWFLGLMVFSVAMVHLMTRFYPDND